MANQWDLMRSIHLDIPVEVYTCLHEYGVQVFNKPLNWVMMREEIPRAWRQSILGPLFNIPLVRCLYFRLENTSCRFADGNTMSWDKIGG